MGGGSERPAIAEDSSVREEILQALGGLPEENVHCAALAAGALKNALQDYLEDD